MAFLSVDILFIFAHILSPFFIEIDNADPHSKRFLLTHDQSYGEFYEYAKSAGCSAAFALIALTRGQSFYLVLSSLFAFITVDNALRIHEKIGHAIGAHVPFGNNLGDLIYFGGIALLMCVLIWWTFPRNDARDRAYAAMSVLLIGLIAFFAIGMDAAHAVFGHFIPQTANLFGLLEDGGEMVALSLNLAFAWSIVRATRLRTSS